MTKTIETSLSQIIKDKAAVLFQKHANLEKLAFFIQISRNAKNDPFYIGDDLNINDIHIDERGDKDIYDIYSKLRDLQYLFRDNKHFFEIKSDIQKMEDRFFDMFVKSDNLSDIWAKNEWSKVIESFIAHKDFQEIVRKEFPWKYINYVFVRVEKNSVGDLEISYEEISG